MTGGLLLVHKPSGPTSYDMIRWIKRAVKGEKIGHCGTLDPLASGLMLILIGRTATRQQANLMGLDKVYKCKMRLGVMTDSGDITGNVIETKSSASVDSAQFEILRQKFTGPQMQVPPMYSALKKDGVPLYKLARKGKTVEREPRAIQINELEFLGGGADEVEFRVRCSSGTYVRTLIEDMAKELGTVATMSGLVRERIGDYQLERAVFGEKLKDMNAEQISQELVAVA